MDLQELTTVILKSWQFDEANYPGIEKLSEPQRRVFALQHILMHQTKAIGKLAEAIEPTDHGRALNEELLALAIRNLLTNTLRLAEIAGISAEELVHTIAHPLSERPTS